MIKDSIHQKNIKIQNVKYLRVPTYIKWNIIKLQDEIGEFTIII